MAKTPKSGDGSDGVALAAGATAYRARDTGDALFVVEDGEIELLDAGDRRLALLAKGDVFGEGAVLDARPREETARAVTACRLIRIDAATLGALARENPDLALYMMRRLSRRLAAAYAAPAAAAVAAPVSATGKPRIVHETGTEFLLDPAGEVMVGRSDRSSRFTPPVDLAPLVPPDAPRSVSRRHAVIAGGSGVFQVRELPKVANGTWVNGVKLAPNVATPLADGDVISFGPVKLAFRLH
jgi:CRP-like cAMP-binding protein